MRKVNCTCTTSKQCKHCYDKDRRIKIKKGVWFFNNPMPTELNSTQEQILIGGLLGDFYLYRHKNHVNAGISCCRSLKDKEYAEFEYEIFKDFCNFGLKNTTYFDKRTNKTYNGVMLRTRVAEVFTPYKNKWYPNGTKIVPQDLRLTPLICAIWFCDDGSVVKSSKKSIRLQLATDGFIKEEVEFLAHLLSKELNQVFMVYPKKNKYVIYASTAAAMKFIKYIEPFFPKSMKRKSDKWKEIV